MERQGKRSKLGLNRIYPRYMQNKKDLTNASAPSEQKPSLKKITSSETTPESKITAGEAGIGKF